MRVSSLVLAAAVALTSAAASAQGPVPERLVFQGRLVRTDGAAETVPQDLRFSIFGQASGGAALWTETHPGVALSNGYYAVELGAATPLGGIFTGAPRWLAVALEGQQEVGPRLSIATSPYALLSGDSARLGGLDEAAFARSSHVHPAATTGTPGFLTGADKTKLDALPDIPDGNGLTVTTVAGSRRLDVTFGGSGTGTTVARANHTHPALNLNCVRTTQTGPLNAGVTASCQTGEELTGGGCEDVPQGSGYTVSQLPVAGGYRCIASGAGAPTTAVTAHAICCRLQ